MTWVLVPAISSFLSVVPQNKVYTGAHVQQHMTYEQFLHFFALLYHQYLNTVILLLATTSVCLLLMRGFYFRQQCVV